jgi:TPR repeat protein
MRVLSILTAVWVLASAAAAGAQTPLQGFELADAYFRRGNFAQAYLTGLPAAQAGDPRAQFLMGNLSLIGRPPIARDIKEAMRWYNLAASRGHAQAQFVLAEAFARGDGVPVDKQRAQQWLNRSAENGYVPAIMSLARLHDEGIGQPRDRAAATDWVRRAAERGDPRAQALLADRLEAGIGTAIDEVAADRWRERAASTAEPMALMSRARDILRERDPKRSALIDAYASAAFVERKVEGSMKTEAAKIIADLSRRLTPAEIAEATAKLATLSPDKL